MSGGLRKRDKAHHSANVRRSQRALQQRGKCRNCGDRIADGSVSRCLACLERIRLDDRRRRGLRTKGPGTRGRPLIGDWSSRRRALKQEDRRRERVQLRKEGQLPDTRISAKHRRLAELREREGWGEFRLRLEVYRRSGYWMP